MFCSRLFSGSRRTGFFLVAVPVLLVSSSRPGRTEEAASMMRSKGLWRTEWSNLFFIRFIFFFPLTELFLWSVMSKEGREERRMQGKEG